MKLMSRDERLALLNRRRDLKMARSAHAYVRGNTARFYEWLAESEVSRAIPTGPAVWICGDCHLGNLGPLADGAGEVAIQIRDFDQAVIGNPAHDLIRLGLSLATAARGSDLPGVTTARMIEQMIDGYQRALARPRGRDLGEEPKVVRIVRRQALGRGWKHLARERLDDVEPRIPLGKRFWELTDRERQALNQVLLDPAVTEQVLPAGADGALREVRLADAAYWMKGCSSLGLLRYAVIAAFDGGKDGRDHALIDLKEATVSVAPVARGAAMPEDPAERVVAAVRALSPHLGERIAPVRMLGHSLFVRELAPQDLKIEVEQFSSDQAVTAAAYLAFIVGQAHARQMDAATRRGWREALRRGRSASLDAPSWLWRAILALSARHEAGYLEHCRRYALAG
jgi:uncharacterized protein (DUF2252 family)